MSRLLLLLLFAACACAQTGLGKSTYTCIDKDGDGYGVGPGCLGPDADDNDASVQSFTQVNAKYGSVTTFLAHLGYSPAHIWLLSPTGSNSTGASCTPAAFAACSPFQNWAGVSRSFAPGDMLMLRGGSYSDMTIQPPAGVSGAPSILMAYPGELPIIDMAITMNVGINIVNTPWIVIDGLKVTGGYNSGCISGGTWGQTASLFHDVAIRHVETSYCKWGIDAFDGLLNILIEENVVHDDTNNTVAEHGMYLGSRTLPSLNVTVRRNIMYNNDYNGLQFNGRVTNLVIEKNIIYSNLLSALSLLEGVSSSTIRDNMMFSNGRAAITLSNYDGDCYISGSTGICPYDQKNNVFENNTVYQTGYDRTGATTIYGSLVVTNSSTSLVGDLGHNTFRNNIFYGYQANGHYPPVWYTSVNPNYLATSTFTNNLFWFDSSVTAGGLVIGIGFDPDWGYQGYSCAQLATMTTITGCIVADPLFSTASSSLYNSPGKFDFSLLPASPAMGAGAAVGAASVDIWGTPRANPPSIGAYEPPTGAAALTLKSLACSPTSLASGGSSTCTVTLSQAAGTSPAPVEITSSVEAVVAPSSVSAQAGSTSITFAVTTGIVSNSGLATITATLNGSSQSTSLTLSSSLAVSSLVCSPASVASEATSSCTVTLSQVAPGGATVTLSSDSSLLGIPPAVQVPAGASTATFTATVGTVLSGSTAVITSQLNGSSQTAWLTLMAGPSASSGWQQLANTALQTVCPPNDFNGADYAFNSYCHNVIDAWSGGAADTKRNRLLIWGGGGSDYYGNEVYALDLHASPAKMTRLTDPSVYNTSNCLDANADGTPASRHSYNDLVYLPGPDRLFTFSGRIAPCDGPTNHTWTLDLSVSPPVWHLMDPPNGLNTLSMAASGGGAICAYDPNTANVLCNLASSEFLQYNYNTNTWTVLNSSQSVPFASSAAIDPVHKLMVFMGHDYDQTAPVVKVVDISSGSTYIAQDWSSSVTGCEALASANYPGLAYSSALGVMVGYPNTGNTIYLFNPEIKTCTARTFANGPEISIGASGTSGTGSFGRFQYFPGIDTFAVVSSANLNAFSLNVTTGGVAEHKPRPKRGAGSNGAGGAVSSCDLNGDGVVNNVDVQIAVNQALGIAPCTTADLQRNGLCSLIDVQRVIAASLGEACVTEN